MDGMNQRDIGWVMDDLRGEMGDREREREEQRGENLLAWLLGMFAFFPSADVDEMGGGTRKTRGEPAEEFRSRKPFPSASRTNTSQLDLENTRQWKMFPFSNLSIDFKDQFTLL